MQLSRSRALALGITAIFAVIALQAFNSFACYHMTITNFVGAWTLFVLIPLIPAFASLFTANPLRAIGACLLFAPWLILAYYTDCVRPYSGGGASMIYVSVLLYGTPCAIIGALISGPIMRAFGISIDNR